MRPSRSSISAKAAHLPPWRGRPGGAFHWLLHLLGDDGAEFMAVFTHGELESLDPIVEEISNAYRCLGRGVVLTRDDW